MIPAQSPPSEGPECEPEAIRKHPQIEGLHRTVQTTTNVITSYTDVVIFNFPIY